MVGVMMAGQMMVDPMRSQNFRTQRSELPEDLT
jgi:hypothetical protein